MALIRGTPAMLRGLGGLAPRRIDQGYDAPHNTLSPGQAGVFRGRQVIVTAGTGGSGVFIYKAAPARGTLIAAAVGAAGKDPTNLNTVSPVLAVGVWSPVTGLPGAQSMVDANGDLSVIGPDGVPRLQIYTGADGTHNAGAAYWRNDFGAVILLIDPVVRATIQYQDTASATQGQVIGAQVASTTTITDPVTGVTLFPGITIIDPVFGDNIRIVGDVVLFDQLGMTRACQISSQDPGPALTNAPFLAVEAPEHTTAKHAVHYLLGATQDGTTHPAKVVYAIASGNAPNPTVNTNNYLEIQTQAGQPGIAVIMGSAANGVNPFDAFISGDTSPRFSIGLLNNTGIFLGPGNAGEDTNLYRAGASTLQSDGNLHLNGGPGNTAEFLSFGAQVGKLAYRAAAINDTADRLAIDNTGKASWGPGNAAADTDLYRSAAGILKTDNEFDPNSLNVPTNAGAHLGVDNTGLLYLIGSSANQGRALTQIVGDTNNRWQIDDLGKQQWGPGNAATDTTLYRQANSELKTDGQFDASILFAASKLALANQGSAPAAAAGDTLMVGSNADLMFTVGANGTTGFNQASQASTTTHTVTQATQTALSDAWTIPAGSLTAQAVYELHAFGHGQQGSTQQGLTVAIVVGSQLFTTTFAAGTLGISQLFRWRAVLRFAVVTAGAGGTLVGELDMLVSAANVPATPNLWESGGTQAINTTVANTFELTAAWTSTTGGPTITCDANYIKKVA